MSLMFCIIYINKVIHIGGIGDKLLTKIKMKKNKKLMKDPTIQIYNKMQIL